MRYESPNIFGAYKHYIRKTLNVEGFERYGIVNEVQYEAYRELLASDYKHWKEVIQYGIDESLRDALAI
jgi:hypothetical protein